MFKKSHDGDPAAASQPRIGDVQPIRSRNVSVIGPTLAFRGERSADDDLVIEHLACNAEGECGEAAESFLDGISKGAREELSMALDTVVSGWLHKHSDPIQFGTIEDCCAVHRHSASEPESK